MLELASKQQVLNGLDRFLELNLLLPQSVKNPLIICTKSLEKYIQTQLKQFAARLKNAPVLSFSSDLLTKEQADNFYLRTVDIEYDGLIAIGGGTVIDLCKIIKSRKTEHVFFVAIPTTVGTGSESTRYATYYEHLKKKSLEALNLLPHAVILDPRFCYSLPKNILRSSGLDAFSQAVESYWSKKATPASQKCSLQALEIMVSHFLPAMSGSQESIAQMQTAANLSGQAIDVSKTTLAHALSYYLSSHFGMPHGDAVAVTLATVAAYNEEFYHEKEQLLIYKKIKDTINPKGFSLASVLEGFISSTGAYSKISALPFSSQINLYHMIEEALLSGRAATNPRTVERDEFFKFLSSVKS